MAIGQSIADRFAATAAADPPRLAISAQRDRVTYGDAGDLVYRVASQLIASGVTPGARVALLCDQRAAGFCALIGVLRSGAIAVPLVPTHPEARLRRILDDCTPSAILADAPSLMQAQALAGPGVAVLGIDGLPRTARTTWPDVLENAPALILYTSGSSGRPKGVVQTHGNLLQKIDACAAVFQTTRDDRFAMLSAPAVGRGMVVLLSALLNGAALCTFDVARQGLAAFVAWLINDRITILPAGPSLFRALAGSVETGSHRFPDLRLVRLGGESVTVNDAAEHQRLFGPHTRLMVSYSTTESGPTAYHCVSPKDTFPDGLVPIGRPLDGVTLAVVDPSGADIAEGEIGELVVRSHYLSPGYWNDPEQTASRFSAVTATGEREYRTGDLGRRRGGLFQYCGRLADRVKIRGFRVELGEVENALGRLADVQHAAVVVRPGSDGDRLVAYVQARAGAHQTTDTLRTALAVQLPEHAIPAAFVFLDKLPLTESGKPDRQALHEPPSDRPELSTPFVLPRTSLETTIAAIWCDVLGLDRVGVNDPFRSLGGNSLKAGVWRHGCRSVVGVELALGDLIDAQPLPKPLKSSATRRVQAESPATN